jgi:predicted GH43/DUF377 family glycosyl hydrolase
MLKESILILMLLVCFNLIATKAYSQTSWGKFQANPVLDIGSAGSWDDRGASHPRVLFDGTVYKMWYSGFDGSNIRIGHATSPDGINWTKAAENPVLDLGAQGTWDAVWVENSMVLFDGTSFQMWYYGRDANSIHRIGYATSSDGVTWDKYSGNPIIEPSGNSGSWNSNRVAQPWVIFDGTSYQMWFGGYDGSKRRTGYATSTDGITWEEYSGNPVLDVGTPGSWDADLSANPSVVFDGSNYHMWYQGRGPGLPFLIGYATSPDGVVWTKDPGNPVLALGNSGTWEGTWHLGPCVLLLEGTYKMWYTGIDRGFGRTGYATSPITGVQDEIVDVPLEYSLAQNYPNPFNPETEVYFQLPEVTQVVVTIFNTRGQETRRLTDINYAAGYHSVRWDGMDNQGNPVSSGVYLYQLRTNNFTRVKKMSLIR